MGGYSSPMSESLGLPEDLSGQLTGMRRRGLIPALAGVTPNSVNIPAGTNRIQDEPVTRNNPEAYGAMSSAQTPVGTSPSQRDTLADQMAAEYQRLSQPEPTPQPMSLKQRLLQGVLRAAPIAAGAIGGGAYGAMGAAQGEEQGIQRQQGMQLAQQKMAQEREQQRNSLKERVLQEMMQQQRTEQQNQQFQQREDQQRKLAEQSQAAREQTLKEQLTARDQETAQKQDFQAAENEKKRKFEGEQADKKEALRREEDDRKFAIMMSKMGEQGTWSLQEDSNTGKPVLFNNKTGETRTAPAGVGPKGSYQKNLGGAIDAQNYAQDYLSRGVYTGPGDEALQEKFFELAKPSTGFRMTQPQINQLQQSRNWMNSIQGRYRHATTGTWFSDTQRKQIVDTMNELAEAKKKAQQAQSGGGAQPAPAQGNAADPLGILK